MGCGPSIHAPVQVEATDDGASSALFAIEILKQGETTARRFYLSERDGKLMIGRGMCGGAWMPEANVAYRITVEAADFAGHRASAPQAFNVTFPASINRR